MFCSRDISDNRSAQDNMFCEPAKNNSISNGGANTSTLTMTYDNYDHTCVFPKNVSPSSFYDSFARNLRDDEDQVYDRSSVSQTNKKEISLDNVYSVSCNNNRQADPLNTYDTASTMNTNVCPDVTYNRLSNIF